MQSWMRNTEVIRQSWQQNIGAEGGHRYSHAGKQENVSKHQCLEMQIPVCRISSISIIFFVILQTELDMFLKEITEQGFLQQRETELGDLADPSLSTQSCFKQLVMVEEKNKARQPSYSVVLFQSKFKPRYQNEETRKLRHVCLSCLEYNCSPEQPSTILTSSTPQPPGYNFALALFSPSFRNLSHQAFKTFCQPGSPVGHNSAQCWRRNLKFNSGGELYVLSKTHLSVHSSVTAQQKTL